MAHVGGLDGFYLALGVGKWGLSDSSAPLLPGVYFIPFKRQIIAIPASPSIVL